MTVRADSRDEGRGEEPRPAWGEELAVLRERLLAWRQDARLSRAAVSRLLLAVVLAVALWVYVTSQENPVRMVRIDNVPITAVGLAPGYVLTPPLGTASVDIQGLDSDLHGVTAGDIQAMVDARKLVPGPGTYLLPVVIKLPPNHHLTLLDQTPAHVRVSVDETAHKSVPVTMVPIGQIPAGYQSAGAPIVEPPVVTITGLRSALARIQIATVEVNLNNAVRTVQESVSPVFVDANGDPVTPQPTGVIPAVVNVTVPIQPQLAFNTLPVVPVVTGQPRPGYVLTKIAVSPSAVTVFGDPRVFATLHTLATQPVSADGLGVTPLVITTTLNPPPGVGLYNQRPVTVTLQAQLVEAQTALPVVVAVTGLAPGWTATPSPATTTVTIKGPALLMGQLVGLQATANVAGLAPGVHTVPLAVGLPPAVQLVAISPAAVRVSLTPPRAKR
jgi:YbbR domain-containing protein